TEEGDFLEPPLLFFIRVLRVIRGSFFFRSRPEPAAPRPAGRPGGLACDRQAGRLARRAGRPAQLTPPLPPVPGPARRAGTPPPPAPRPGSGPPARRVRAGASWWLSSLGRGGGTDRQKAISSWRAGAGTSSAGRCA